MKNRIVVASALAAVMIFACSSNSTDSASAGGDDGGGGNASVVFALSGSDFTDHSVRICGARLDPAEGEYRCDSTLEYPDPGDNCPCFDFTPDGHLVDGSGNPLVVGGLCPSSDIPASNWSFQYAIYDQPACAGTQINDGTHDFTCFDSRDFASQNHPNQSVEALNPGPNTNHILCIATNASKTWDFTACAITTTSADVGNLRYDCGCQLVAAACTCGSGMTAADLEQGCSFDPATCEILCPVPPPPPPP